MTAGRFYSARELGMLSCHCCGQVNRDIGAELRCGRCHARLHRRKPASVTRTWALLLAAMILYVPANVLPMMRTGSLFSDESNTILSGVIVLWHAGSWDLAVIVFIASILVPLLKFTALLILLISVQRGTAWHRAGRARLFRMIEEIGQWSMLDVFVVTILVALVRFRPLALVEPGPAVLYFGLVVVLTMLASRSFDPRLVWDNAATGKTQAARGANDG